MAISIKVKTDNAAFEDSPCAEVARILRDLADKLENFAPRGGLPKEPCNLRDINGNTVGHIKFS
jgi:hypothetical protein